MLWPSILQHTYVRVAFAPTQRRTAESCHILTKYSSQSTTMPSYTTSFSTNTIDGCLKQLQEPSRNHSLHLAMAATLFNRHCLLVWLSILLSYHQSVPMDFSVPPFEEEGRSCMWAYRFACPGNIPLHTQVWLFDWRKNQSLASSLVRK